MWPFTRSERRTIPKIDVPRTEEVRELQFELTLARMEHAETVHTVRKSLQNHRDLLDDALMAFERKKHVRD